MTKSNTETRMSELWIPGTTEHPDPTNVFDMMELFQDEIKWQFDSEYRMVTAMNATRALSQTLKSMKPEERRVSVSTSFAVIDDTSQAELSGVIIEHDVGVLGEVVDINCISIGARLPMSFALQMDIERIFPIDRPANDDIIFSTGNVPISRVAFIEQIAS